MFYFLSMALVALFTSLQSGPVGGLFFARYLILLLCFAPLRIGLDVSRIFRATKTEDFTVNNAGSNIEDLGRLDYLMIDKAEIITGSKVFEEEQFVPII